MTIVTSADRDCACADAEIARNAERLRERRAGGDVRDDAAHRQRAMLSFAIGKRGAPSGVDASDGMEREERAVGGGEQRGAKRREPRRRSHAQADVIVRGVGERRASWPGRAGFAPAGATSCDCFARLVLRVIVAEHVQRAVNDQTRHLFAHADPRARALLARDVRRNVDVANDRIARRRARKTERDDVRRPGMIRDVRG